MTNMEFWREFNDSRVTNNPPTELAINGRSLCSPELFLSRVGELIQKAGIKHDDTVVDIGCGTGLAVSTIRPFCKHICGLDISQNMVEYGKQKHGVELQVHDITNPLADSWNGTKNKVLCGALQFLENKDDVVKAVKNIAAILKPGGRALLYDIQNNDLKENYDYNTTIDMLNFDADQRAIRLGIENRRLWIDPKWLSNLANEIGFSMGVFYNIKTAGFPLGIYVLDLVLVK